MLPIRFLAAASVLLFLATACAPPTAKLSFERQAWPHEASDLAPDPRVLYGQLDNGLRYAIMENATPPGTASIRMRVAVGSLNEADDELGIAHYLEHMAFNGTTNVPEGELIPRLERYGLSFGADANAHTSFDETVYKLNLPTVNPEVLDKAFFVLRETASEMSLAQDAIDRERGIILSEKRARKTNAFKEIVARWAFLTGDSNLMSRMPIGVEETIESVDEEQFHAFYNANYHPEKTFLVFVGDVPADEVLTRVKASFGEWHVPGEPDPIVKPTAAVMRPGAIEVFSDPDVMTSITMSVLQPRLDEPDTLEVRQRRLIEYLASTMLAKRLDDLRFDPDSGVINASANWGQLFGTARQASIRVRTDPEHWETAMISAHRSLRESIAFGFTEEELELALSDYGARFQRAANEAATPLTHGWMGSGMVDRILSAYADERVLMHPADSLERFIAIRDTITLASIQQALESMWSGYEQPMTFMSTAALDSNLPERITTALQKSVSSELNDPRRAVAQAFQYSDFGTPQRPEKYDLIDAASVHLYTFPNNVKLNFKQTDFVDNQVLVNIRVGEGALSLPRKDEALRRLALNLLSKGGLVAHNQKDLSDSLRGFDMNYRLFFAKDSDAINLSGRASPETLPQLLNLLTAFTYEPGLREEAADRYLRSLAAWYPTHDSTPIGVAEREIPRLIRSGDPRFGFPPLEDFLSADYDEAAVWLKDQLTSGRIEVSIVGDIDSDTVLDEVSRTLGALPERAKTARVFPKMTSLSFPRNQDQAHVFYHAGDPEQALLRVYWSAPDAGDLVVGQQMRVLRSIFRNEMVAQIREGAAVSYSPSMGLYSSPTFQDFGYIFASVQVLPEDIDRTLNGIWEVAKKFHDGHITDDMFERALRPIQKDLTASVNRNGYWINALSDAQSEGRGLERHMQQEAILDSMSAKDLNELAKDVFNDENALIVQILPEFSETAVGL